MSIELYAFRFSVYREADENPPAWVPTGPLGSCRTETGGEHTVASSTDSLMPPLLSDSTLNYSRASAGF